MRCLLFLLPALPALGADYTHGIAVALEGRARLVEAAHADSHFPLMSVVKFPLAIVVLHEVEQGRLSLHQGIALGAAELDPKTWSPLLKAHPQGGSFTLLELLYYSLVESDNNACNALFRVVGGAGRVHGFFRERMGQGFAMTIRCDEGAFRDRGMMRANHASPRAMVQLLRATFGEQRLLNRHHTRLLRELMEQPSAAAPRVGLGLPAGCRFAHKTGSSGTEQGVTIAFNDVGVVQRPGCPAAYVASFIRDRRADAEGMNRAHAALGARVAAYLGAAPARQGEGRD